MYVIPLSREGNTAPSKYSMTVVSILAKDLKSNDNTRQDAVTNDSESSPYESGRV